MDAHRALTSSKWDEFHMVDDNRIATYASRYYLNVPQAQGQDAYIVEPTIRLQKNGQSLVSGQWKTDVESDLRNLSRASTKVRCDNYNPETNKITNNGLKNAPDGNFPVNFVGQTQPACTLRGTGWNRWEPLLRNPQEHFETPFDHFIPSRLLDKEKCKTH
jgi:hypothetical protein